MARIIVTAEDPAGDQPRVLLEESVHPVHISTGHAADQLIERLGWALRDAEELERLEADRQAGVGLAA